MKLLSYYFSRILEENYNTITQLAFQPYDLNDGYEDLPVQVLGQKSAFTHTATHIPLDSKVIKIKKANLKSSNFVIL